MRLRYNYEMCIDFSFPVTRHCFSLRCMPHDTARQRIFDAEVLIEPAAERHMITDSGGSVVVYGRIDDEHDRFSVISRGTAETGNAIYEEQSADSGVFSVGSAYTMPGRELRALYRRISADAPSGQYDRAVYFMRSVYDFMCYIPNVTDIKTTAEEAAKKRCGVCQDYAHILIALLRMDGIPARYAVGIMTGEGASHAWTEVNLGGFWYGLDPTNNLLTDGHYIKISHGRDYRDCIVSKGVFRGAAEQHQTVKVVVEEV